VSKSPSVARLRREFTAAADAATTNWFSIEPAFDARDHMHRYLSEGSLIGSVTTIQRQVCSFACRRRLNRQAQALNDGLPFDGTREVESVPNSRCRREHLVDC
jgi:hypothetical protein